MAGWSQQNISQSQQKAKIVNLEMTDLAPKSWRKKSKWTYFLVS